MTRTNREVYTIFRESERQARGSGWSGLPGDRRERGGGQEKARGESGAAIEQTGARNIEVLGGRNILHGSASGEDWGVSGEPAYGGLLGGCGARAELA